MRNLTFSSTNDGLLTRRQFLCGLGLALTGLMLSGCDSRRRRRRSGSSSSPSRSSTPTPTPQP